MIETPQQQPSAGPTARDISIDLIALRWCEFTDTLFEAKVLKPEEQPVETSGDGANISAEVGVWISKEDQTALVRLAIRVEPTAQPSWNAGAEFVGRYSAGENPVMPIENFAWNNGIAYLVPFIRERLAGLTAGSIHGTYLLPPLSVPSLLALARVADVQVPGGAGPGGNPHQIQTAAQPS